MGKQIKGILGTKLGMTQVFNDAGQIVPVTVVQAGPCVVTAVRTPDSDGYLIILVTRPAPTVRPPSRIANRSWSSMAMGWMRLTVMSVRSPGITISVPSGSVTTPVTSVVRK